MEVLQLILLAILPALAIVAALKDLTSMKIPNWISGLLILGFVPAALLVGLAPMAVATLPNWVEMLVPRAVTAAMITTAMRAAIRPYSMAVAPDSSDMNFEMNFFMVFSSLADEDASY